MIQDLLNLLGPAVGVILTSGVVAAVVAFLQNRWLENRRGQEAERTRLRQTFAEAFAAYADYKEFPYAIRRRRADQEAEERARLSSELVAIQSKLSFYRTWTLFESPQVGEAYSGLLSQMRRIAGAAMHEAWEQTPTQNDAEMNISLDQVDLRSLATDEDNYIGAVARRLDELEPRRFRKRRMRRVLPESRSNS
jgi:hypothetical protein